MTLPNFCHSRAADLGGSTRIAGSIGRWRVADDVGAWSLLLLGHPLLSTGGNVNNMPLLLLL